MSENPGVAYKMENWLLPITMIRCTNFPGEIKIDDATARVDFPGSLEPKVLTFARYDGCITPTGDVESVLKEYQKNLPLAKMHDSLKWADESIAKERDYLPVSIGDQQVSFALIEFTGHLRQGMIHCLAWNTLTPEQRQVLLLEKPDIAHQKHSFERVRQAAPK